METLRRFADNTRLLAYSLAPPELAGTVLLPFCCALLFGLFLPGTAGVFRGALPYFGNSMLPVLALAFVHALWCCGMKRALLPAALGAGAGCLITAQYAGAASVGLLLASAMLLAPRKPGTVSKHAVLLAIMLVMLPLGILMKALSEVTMRAVLVHLVLAGVTLAVSCVEMNALSAARCVRKGRALSDWSAVAFSVFAGIIAVAFGQARPLGIGLGAAFAAVFCMAAAQAKGIAGVACAAIAAGMRVFLMNGDLLLIAVLCSCTLFACLVRSFGRAACAAGFAVPAVAFFAVNHGSGALRIGEILLSSAVFLLLPKRLTTLPGAELVPERTEKLERRLLFQNEKLSELSSVLGRLASLFEDGSEPAESFIGTQLGGVAGSLSRLAVSIGEVRPERFDISIGSASFAKKGCAESGDSLAVRDFDGMYLAAISDGMGSGSAARRESSQAVDLLADLVTCGFRLDEAADCVNRLLLLREGGENYATLDAILFDPMSGTMSIAKHGAPPCYLLRGGKVGTLYAEALPVGILEEAKTAVCTAKMRRGDTVVMMSDGAADAFGDELAESIKENADRDDPKLCAELLAGLAAGLSGGRDDCSVIVAHID